MFKCAITALITPFKDCKVDGTAYQELVEWQIEQGTDALVPCGTTGESPTLTQEELKRVIKLCVEATHKRVPVIAGTGSNCTEKTIHMTEYAKDAGADAALIVMPYYNKPSQEGLYQHYKAVNDAVELPIIIYNVPCRSVADMSVETMARLAKLPNIVGVKDATADLARPLETRLAIGKDFCQLSGEDATVTAFLAQGGHGCISVTGNVAPKMCSDLHKAWAAGDFDKAFELRDKLMPLHDAMFVESNPCPVKYALSLMGKCSPYLRPPLCEISEASKEKVRNAMKITGIL